MCRIWFINLSFYLVYLENIINLLFKKCFKYYNIYLTIKFYTNINIWINYRSIQSFIKKYLKFLNILIVIQIILKYNCFIFYILIKFNISILLWQKKILKHESLIIIYDYWLYEYIILIIVIQYDGIYSIYPYVKFHFWYTFFILSDFLYWNFRPHFWFFWNCYVPMKLINYY